MKAYIQAHPFDSGDPDCKTVLDTISKEYRLVGDFRLIKYASFLMKNYFPLHHT